MSPRFLAPLLAVCLPAMGDVPEHFLRTATPWMESADPGQRAAAYRSWMQLGPEAMSDYRKVLEEISKYHDQQVKRLCTGYRGSTNAYLEHRPLAERLDDERARLLPLIHTDWKKDPKKIAELRRGMETLGKMNQQARKAAQASTREFDALLESHETALGELYREMQRFDNPTRFQQIATMDAGELRKLGTEMHIEGRDFEKLRQRFRQTRDEARQLEEINAANNQAGPWVEAATRDFALVLNTNRSLLGLRPLSLEEHLSAAAKGHSGDMANLGFFAHESPVSGKKTPGDRARKAGFRGGGIGENIFVGSSNFQSAYDAWFASDGHRMIMMASGPRWLGVGVIGRHWTMMTGG